MQANPGGSPGSGYDGANGSGRYCPPNRPLPEARRIRSPHLALIGNGAIGRLVDAGGTIVWVLLAQAIRWN